MGVMTWDWAESTEVGEAGDHKTASKTASETAPETAPEDGVDASHLFNALDGMIHFATEFPIGPVADVEHMCCELAWLLDSWRLLTLASPADCVGIDTHHVRRLMRDLYMATNAITKSFLMPTPADLRATLLSGMSSFGRYHHRPWPSHSYTPPAPTRHPRTSFTHYASYISHPLFVYHRPHFPPSSHPVHGLPPPTSAHS